MYPYFKYIIANLLLVGSNVTPSKFVFGQKVVFHSRNKKKLLWFEGFEANGKEMISSFIQ